MLNKALQKEIGNNLPDPVYCLLSKEALFLDDALSKFIEIVMDAAPPDFNQDTFDPSSSPEEILNAASTLPFMARRRLVVLRDFHQFTASSIKALAPYFKEPAETTCMVILSQKALQKSIQFDWKVFQLDIKESEIPAWLKQAASKKGVRLTDEAVDYLIDYIGYEAGLLMMETEKLSSTGNTVITGKDVIESTSMTREYTTFDLVDALAAGQSSRAFRILKALLSGRSDAPAIIGTLNWHYKQFYSLWVNKGKRPAKMWDKTYRALVKYVPSFKEDDFLRIFQSLHEADQRVKSSGRPEPVLELLLLKLLQKGSWTRQAL